MQRNLGRERVVELTNSEDWGCLVCDPTQIYKQKATYFALYQCNKSPDFARKRIKVKRHAPAKRSNSLSRKADEILNSPQNFIEENIGKCFCQYGRFIRFYVFMYLTIKLAASSP